MKNTQVRICAFKARDLADKAIPILLQRGEARVKQVVEEHNAKTIFNWKRLRREPIPQRPCPHYLHGLTPGEQTIRLEAIRLKKLEDSVLSVLIDLELYYSLRTISEGK